MAHSPLPHRNGIPADHALASYDYLLPPELIAQAPAQRRSDARLLAADAASATLRHLRVSQWPGLLRRGDLVVVNDTRVVPSRLLAVKPTGGRVELLALPAHPDTTRDAFVALARSSRPLRPGASLRLLAAPSETLRVVRRRDDGRVVVERTGPGRTRPLPAWLEAFGSIPLPPYIRREHGPRDEDRRRYQTVFARQPGAVAAPTAGLHLDDTVLEAIARAGARVASVTLHVGPATFEPVRTDDLREHHLEPEWAVIPVETARAIEETRRAGGRVVAVGTTVVRTLESFARPDGTVRAATDWARAVIRPGFSFRVVDALLTNFHLPRSSLLVLVCSFAGRERVLAAYREAVRRRYRFYSYGDATWFERRAQ